MAQLVTPVRKRDIIFAFLAKVLPLNPQLSPSIEPKIIHPAAPAAPQPSPYPATPEPLPTEPNPTPELSASAPLPISTTLSIRRQIRKVASSLGIRSSPSNPHPQIPAAPVPQPAGTSFFDLNDDDQPGFPFPSQDGYNDESGSPGLGLLLGPKGLTSRISLRSMGTRLKSLFSNSQGRNMSEVDLGMDDAPDARPIHLATNSFKCRGPSLEDVSTSIHLDSHRLSRSSSSPALPKSPGLITTFPTSSRSPPLAVATDFGSLKRPTGSAPLVSPRALLSRSPSSPWSSTKSPDSPQSQYSEIFSIQSPASTAASSLPDTSPIAEGGGGGGDVLENIKDLTNFVMKVDPIVCMRGGYSDVFKAINLITGAFVAIKRFRAIHVECEFDSLECFQRLAKRQKREAMTLGAIKNPRITPLLGHAVVDGSPALVMVWYENGHASDYLTKNAQANRKKLVFQVAEGLACLHSGPFPIVHADVKPFNVLIDDNGDAALSDFGLAKVLNRCSTGNTTSNDPCYSIRYTCPETLEEHPKSIEGDVYSFACLAFEILTGSLPFSKCRNSAALIMAKTRGDLPPREESLLISDTLWVLLERCWCRDPTSRPTMNDIVRELTALGWDQER